jgi:hypothetical protein
MVWSFIRFPHSIRFFLQQIEVVLFSWSFVLQQFVHIFVFLYHIMSEQFTSAYCSTRTLCPSLLYHMNFLQHTLMSCLSLSLPDAQFPSFIILFLLCAFEHCSLMLERAHDIEAFFVSWITDVQSSESSLYHQFDVRGSVHHSIIHIENPTRCNSVSKFYFVYIYIYIYI